MSTLILLTSYTVYVMSEQKVLDTCWTVPDPPTGPIPLTGA